MRFTSEESILLSCTAFSTHYRLHTSTVFGGNTHLSYKLTVFDCQWLTVSDVWRIEVPPQIVYVTSQPCKHSTGLFRRLLRCS